MKKLLIMTFITLLFISSLVSAKKIYVAEVEGMIAQGTVNQFEKALSEAKDGEILIIKLDTNGGMAGSMEKIIKMIENTDLPVVIYVAPSGAKAFSAGTFILMASHVAAMANSTVIGACQPRIVNPATGLPEKADEKEINAYAALIETLALTHGRNESMAEKFVTENVALNEREALDAGVIEIVASDLKDLLDKLDGMEVKVKGEIYKINVSNASIEIIKWSIRDKFINYISDPQIASLLLTIGIFGLIFGFLTPGFHLPETIGAIFIILALYGLSFIGINVAGILLILLAFLFFIVEALTPTFGFWTAAAIITFIFGIMLIPAEKAMHEMPLSWYTSFRIASLVVAIFLTAFFSYALAKAIKAKKRRPKIGEEDMVGLKGKAITDISPEKPGQVKVKGSIWRAEANEEIKEGEEIVVVEQKGLTLRVRKA
ncbi:MAG TPA: nodulation protein NfeD [Thermoplasmatales archaeon]|nr:nodulation protein NfeD [Thermoplasmatales archaeon]